MTNFVLFFLVLLVRLCNSESDDNIGDIIIHGAEKSLTGTDRVAILRTKANHVRYSLISTGEECALKRFVQSKPVTTLFFVSFILN